MKRLSLLAGALLVAQISLAQAPQKMSYQAVARDASNALITNSTIGMRISILQGSASVTVVYEETQTPVTNNNCVASLEIGSVTVVSGNFSAIDWASGPYFVKTETDPTGGTNYTIVGVNQFLIFSYFLFLIQFIYLN